MPASAMIVTTYGSIASRWRGMSTSAVGSQSWSDSASANRSAAASTPNGWRRPTIATPSAMNPRPPTSPSSKVSVWPIDRYTPPRPASIPVATTQR